MVPVKLYTCQLTTCRRSWYARYIGIIHKGSSEGSRRLWYNGGEDLRMVRSRFSLEW